MDLDNLWIVLALRTLSKQIIVTVRVIQLLIILIYHKEHSEFKEDKCCPASREGLLK